MAEIARLAATRVVLATKAAEAEAMQTLTGIAKESVFKGERPDLAVEVRSTTARLFRVSIIARNASTKQ
ncbi:hypothetical protein [Bradyrhizobium manausense]|uniref:hypothetical protein n=1 Tax=Bradyrhizobium manausense TaxID=989370 RepID=UPI001BA52C70|nr:hypothetical protein [Bradyrhizobium manausense]MBR0722063.1 hypothetical protein [Bradyrhizobium manausense]